MVCPKCQSTVRDGARFCTACGLSFVPVSQAQQGQQHPQQQGQQRPQQQQNPQHNPQYQGQQYPQQGQQYPQQRQQYPQQGQPYPQQPRQYPQQGQPYPQRPPYPPQRQYPPQDPSAAAKPRHTNITLIVILVVAVAALICILAALLGNKKADDGETTQSTVTTAAAEETSSAAPSSAAPAPSEPIPTSAPAPTEPVPTAPQITFWYPETQRYIDFEVPASGYVIEDSDVRRISESELYGMTEHQVCIARNEIYARHGKIFNGDIYIDYFNHMSWYSERSSNVALTELERANITTITTYEKSRGW